jgi:hypothetical protein
MPFKAVATVALVAIQNKNEERCIPEWQCQFSSALRGRYFRRWRDR